MARTPQVTRNLTVTEVKAVCIDVEAGRPVTKMLKLARSYPNDDLLLKNLRKAFENDKLKIAYISEKSVSKDTYVMTEQEYIQVAHKINK